MNTKIAICSLLGFALLHPSARAADEVVFQDDFAGRLGEGWSWVREEKQAWRVSDQGLEMRVLPGNLWGRANDVKNILVRPAPDPAAGPIEVWVSVSNRPTHQYEQANVAWYFDDSHMVKLGLELVDRQVCIVMGREEADRIRTLAKIPVSATSVQLRLLVDNGRIRGQYRVAGTDPWLEAGAGDLPAPAGGRAKISLHCYQGAPDTEHWAKFGGFRVLRTGK